MPRRSAEDKAETHAQIIEHAARAFRAHGSGVGIGEVMKEIGLTHGGFYRHFDTKEELLVEAITLSLDQVADKLVRVAEKAQPGDRLCAIIETYLSSEHLRHPEAWCALATLAPDIGRQSLAVRKRLDAAMQRYAAKLAPYMPGATVADRQKNFLLLFSGMAGALAMARAIGDRAMREGMLAMSREYYLSAFATKVR